MVLHTKINSVESSCSHSREYMFETQNILKLEICNCFIILSFCQILMSVHWKVIPVGKMLTVQIQWEVTHVSVLVDPLVMTSAIVSVMKRVIRRIKRTRRYSSLE